MTKDERIKSLEEEVLSARATIIGLTNAIEELSKRVGSSGTVIHYPAYVYPYTQPYRWNGGQWTYSTGTSGTISCSNVQATSYLQIQNGDDDGESGVRAAV